MASDVRNSLGEVVLDMRRLGGLFSLRVVNSNGRLNHSMDDRKVIGG